MSTELIVQLQRYHDRAMEVDFFNSLPRYKFRALACLSYTQNWLFATLSPLNVSLRGL